MEEVKNRIKELCDQQGISYFKLAKRAKLATSTVYEIMGGKCSNISVTTIKKLCDGLQVNVSDFFNSAEFRIVGTPKNDRQKIER